MNARRSGQKLRLPVEKPNDSAAFFVEKARPELSLDVIDAGFRENVHDATDGEAHQVSYGVVDSLFPVVDSLSSFLAVRDPLRSETAKIVVNAICWALNGHGVPLSMGRR